MDYKKLKDLLEKLLKYLEIYKNESMTQLHIRRVKNCIFLIDNLNISTEYELELKKNLKLLFPLHPVRGGISDFYIWKNNSEERVLINKTLEEVKHQIWEIVKMIYNVY